MSTVHGPGDVGSPQQRAARTHPRGRGPPPLQQAPPPAASTSPPPAAAGGAARVGSWWP